MKVLYVATVSGTINSFLIPHIKMLLKSDHQVDIACKITWPIEDEILNSSCNIFNIDFQRSPFSKRNVQAYKTLKEIIGNGEYDLIHTHTPVASFLTRFACRGMSDIKVLYTAHGFHFLKGGPIKYWLLYYPLERITARWTDGLVTINEEDYKIAKKMNLRQHNAVYKTHGVGINLQKFKPASVEEKLKLREKYDYQKNDFILVYVAELNENKHQDLLIEVVYLLVKKMKNIKLLLVGPGSFKERYENQIQKNGLEENVFLLGARDDIPDILRLTDIVVASSKREGLPVNIMEAMATGLPIVATDRRGHRDLIRDGENGFLVDATDVKSFANKIKEIHNSTEIIEKFRFNNLKDIQLYEIDNVLEELEVIYLNYDNG